MQKPGQKSEQEQELKTNLLKWASLSSSAWVRSLPWVAALRRCRRARAVERAAVPVVLPGQVYLYLCVLSPWLSVAY